MKPFEPQPTSPIPETEFVSCSSIAPLLMELFDGEADEISAKRARAHLLACEHCAQAWLEWNQTQSILRTHPVPAPPPTLLWRIILAARFANFKRQSRFGFFSRKSAPALGALYSQLEPHEAPAALKSQILNATSRQKKAPVAVRTASYEGRKKSVWPAFSMLAAPALAAFLLIVSHGSLEFEPSTPIPSESQTSEVEVEEAPAVNQVTKPRVAAKAPEKHVVKAAVPAAKPHVKHEVVSSEPEVPAVRVQPSREVEVNEVATPIRRPIARTVNFSHDEEPSPRVSNSARPHTVVRDVVEVTPRPVVLVRPVLAKAIEVEVAPAAKRVNPIRLAAKPALSDDVERPRSQVAQPQPAKPVLARSLALSTHLPTRVTTPVASKITLVASNVDEGDSEEHINELQSVVADFRSALSEDGSDDAFAADES